MVLAQGLVGFDTLSCGSFSLLHYNQIVQKEREPSQRLQKDHVQVLMALSARIRYWYSRVFLTLMMWRRDQLSSLSLWLKLGVCPLGLPPSTIEKIALLTSLLWVCLTLCFFFMAWYFLTKTTSGTTSSQSPSFRTMRKFPSSLMTLNSGLGPFASAIHLFISPAITMNSHFFSSAFICISVLRDSSLWSRVSSDVKPLFRNFWVIFSQVVFFFDFVHLLLASPSETIDPWPSSPSCTFVKYFWLTEHSSRESFFPLFSVFLFCQIPSSQKCSLSSAPSSAIVLRQSASSREKEQLMAFWIASMN